MRACRRDNATEDLLKGGPLGSVRDGTRYAWEIERDREITHKYLADHRARFEELRREFFFIDLYTENAQRFDFSFEECQPRT